MILVVVAATWHHVKALLIEGGGRNTVSRGIQFRQGGCGSVAPCVATLLQKLSHDDANNLCSFDSMKSYRKLINESEERRRRIIYVMSRLIDRKMKHFQDVNMFFLPTQNLSNELNAKVAAFDAQQFNYEFCDTEKGTHKVKLRI
uniref:Uncharacterized protein n=1 Tax=Solanum tuberosum TaxID=4113 RepID=M1DM67_SOLTU